MCMKTNDFKPSRICTYEKTPGVGVGAQHAAPRVCTLGGAPRHNPHPQKTRVRHPGRAVHGSSRKGKPPKLLGGGAPGVGGLLLRGAGGNLLMRRQFTWCVEIKQICRSSSYVKNVSVSSPADSVCPSPDCTEIRLNSSSGIPNNRAALPHVTYLGTWLFIVFSLAGTYAGSITIASSSTAKIIVLYMSISEPSIRIRTVSPLSFSNFPRSGTLMSPETTCKITGNPIQLAYAKSMSLAPSGLSTPLFPAVRPDTHRFAHASKTENGTAGVPA